VAFIRKFGRLTLLMFWASVASSLFAQQPPMTINGLSNFLSEGQSYTFTVSVSDPTIQNIGISVEYPFPTPQPTSTPNQFTFTLPLTIPPGTYHLTAIGTNSAGVAESNPFAVDIERSDDPVSIWAEPLALTLPAPAAQQGLVVYATYSDGTRLVVSNASKTLFSCDNTQIATIAATGLGGSIVTAVSAGQASITISSGASASFPVAVIVNQPASTSSTPQINTVVPSSGTSGVTQVTVTGSGFGTAQGTGTLQLGTLAATVNSWSDTTIVATVASASLTGVAEVVQGGQNSNQVPFTVVAPTISSVTPASGKTGTPVVIAGAHFGSTQGTSSLTFNRGAASITSWSDTSISTSAPANASTGPVVVVVNGSPSNGANFTVTPNITSLSPNTGPVGTVVTVAGTGFGASQGTSSVSFAGTAGVPTSWTISSITVPVPSGAASGNVSVTVGGITSNALSFTLGTPPSITTLSPASGAVGAAITISGANFGATPGTSTVKFGAVTATPTSWSAGSIVAPVPTGAATGNVVVTVNSVASNAVAFTVLPAPSITSLSPTSGAVGSSVTITGSNFGASQGSGTVKFGGVTATPTSWSATSIKVPVPSGAASGNVVVHASGVDSNGKAFTVLPTPTISSLSPTSGSVGTTVTITGTNFGSTQGTSTVKFNTKVATITSWSATSIKAKVPTGATTGNVVVTVSAVASNGKTFTVH
jgi:hypothetical protein